MLAQMPKVNAYEYQASVETWIKLGPLTIDEIVQNSETPVKFDNENLEVKDMKFSNCQKLGQFRRGTQVIEGVARRIWFDDNQIEEGVYVDGVMNGYGRNIYSNGEYYVGMFQDGNKNGQGKRVYIDGRIEEGIFKDGVFVGH